MAESPGPGERDQSASAGLTDGMIPMGDSVPVMNWREQRQKAETSLQYALMTDEQQQTAQDYERIIFKQVPESIYDLYEAGIRDAEGGGKEAARGADQPRQPVGTAD